MTAPTLTRLLLDRTREVHERTERAPFVAGLVSGERGVGDWVRLLGQLAHVYAALEAVAADRCTDPVISPFADRRLFRTAALRADLAELAGDPEPPSPLPVTLDYVAAVEATRAWPAGYVAHHWVRYLGDLSGGQVLRVLLGRSLGLAPEQLRFYDFAGLKPKPFKDAYHGLLDAAPFDEAERDAVAAEAVRAFEHNAALFAALAAPAPPVAAVG